MTGLAVNAATQSLIKWYALVCGCHDLNRLHLMIYLTLASSSRPSFNLNTLVRLMLYTLHARVPLFNGRERTFWLLRGGAILRLHTW
jgi:hypothetical protein